MKRELAPAEVAEIAALAAEFPDLRTIRPRLAELQQRVDDLGSVSLDAVIVRPRNVSDLIALHSAKLVDEQWIQDRLGIRKPAPEDAPAGPATQLRVVEPDYTIKDKRVSG
jgi:hypothetical protein